MGNYSLGEAILGTGVDLAGLKAGLDRGHGEADGALAKMEGAFGGGLKVLLGAAMAGIGAVVAGVGAFGVAAFGAGQRLDEAFDRIVVGTGATGDRLEGLKGALRDVFTAIPTDAGPAAEVIAELNRRLGLTGAALADVAKPLLEASRLLGGDAAANTALYTRLVGDWGIATADQAGTLDKLFAASQATGVGMDALMGRVVQFGAPLRLMGFTLADSIALFGKWEREGVNAELVMGSLRIAAGKFADDGQPLRDSLLATFQSIHDNTDASAALAEAMDVFGARAGPDMAAAIREGRFEIDDLLAVLGESDGAIARTAAATADFGERWAVLKNKATVALEPLGLKLMDIATTVVDRFAPMVEQGLGTLTAFLASPGFQAGLDGILQAVTQLAEGNLAGALTTLFGPEIAAQAMGFITTLSDFLTSTALPALQRLGDWLMNVGLPALVQFATVAWSQLGPGLQQLGVWIQQLATAAMPVLQQAIAFVVEHWQIFAGIAAVVGAVVLALTAPIAAVIAAVVLLATAWANNWGGIQEKTAAVMAFVQAIVSTVLGWLTGFWQANGESILTIAQFVWSGIADAVQTRIGQVMTVVNAITGFIAAVWAQHGAMLLENAQRTWEFIKKTVRLAITFVGAILDAVAAAIRGDWEAFGEALRAAWDAAWQQIVNIFSTAWGNLRALVASLVNSVKGAFTQIDWGAIGRGIIDGIVRGLTGAAGGLATAATNAAKAAFEAAKGFLGIHSPSTVFAELGEQMMAGMALGIEGGLELPRVALAAEMRMATAGPLAGDDWQAWALDRVAAGPVAPSRPAPDPRELVELVAQALGGMRLVATLDGQDIAASLEVRRGRQLYHAQRR